MLDDPEPPVSSSTSSHLSAEDSAQEIARCLEGMALPSHTSDQGMAELCESPLAHAVTCHLEIKYPNLQEYKSLILAEIVELSLTTAGVQSLAHDPNAFVEKAVKRAMVCLAQVRVALRQAVRDELQAKEETRTSPAATPAVKAQQEQP